MIFSHSIFLEGKRGKGKWGLGDGGTGGWWVGAYSEAINP
jgi:hypothetical protein